jgi:5-methylcytosine-specific restriction protein A
MFECLLTARLVRREDEMRHAAQLIRDGMSTGDLIEANEAVVDVDDLGDGEASEGRLII